MSYESSGSGVFMVRPGLSRADAVEALEEIGLSFQSSFELLKISFSGAIYHLEKELEVIRKYFNGEFDVSGDKAEDLWKLVFRDGKIYTRKAKILYDEPEELERLDDIWK